MKKILFPLASSLLFVSLAFFPLIEGKANQKPSKMMHDAIIFDSDRDAVSDSIIGNELSGIYFVIGIGIYIEGGTWPVYEFIAPVFLIRLGKPSGPHILTHYSGESIDFMEGDKFFGYYPFLNPIGIGFVCGLWIDVE